jgi:hypothetical protein
VQGGATCRAGAEGQLKTVFPVLENFVQSAAKIENILHGFPLGSPRIFSQLPSDRRAFGLHNPDRADEKNE